MGAYDMILHKPGRMMRGSRSHCKIAGLLSSFRLRCSSNAESLKTLLRKGAHWSIEGMHFKGVAASTSCSGDHDTLRQMYGVQRPAKSGGRKAIGGNSSAASQSSENPHPKLMERQY